MKWRSGGNYTMEALALVSVLVIVGIFFFSHFQRQMDALDKEAWRLAQKIKPVAEKFYAADPQGRLTPQVLLDQGLKQTPPIMLQVPADLDRPENWQVSVWHPDGTMLFVVTSKGVESKNK